ncbi:MAG TPA: MOSC N-terminal beta barrel domain-containing protein [Terriglobales bacterium]|nr:MOSC N-terminal beta barrel domain-containing protein [Terriglobales bacterium]
MPERPSLTNIRLHPIKALDPVSVQEARIGPNGGLELDRVWALFASDGQWINGKRTAAVHLIRANYDPEITRVTLSVPGDSRRITPETFSFPAEFERASRWFADYFEQPVIVRYIREGAPDDGLAPGPTIVSTATLQAVCDIFPGMAIEEARERFRTTLEIEGVPAFWEDQLFGPDENYAVRFKIGDVAFEGSNPCARCPVPPRNPRTGEINIEFTKKYTQMRRSSLPAWSPETRFDHYYRFSTNTRVPSSETGKLLRVGDCLCL